MFSILHQYHVYNKGHLIPLQYKQLLGLIKLLLKLPSYELLNNIYLCKLYKHVKLTYFFLNLKVVNIKKLQLLK